VQIDVIDVDLGVVGDGVETAVRPGGDCGSRRRL
jgi:hypothetical protein